MSMSVKKTVLLAEDELSVNKLLTDGLRKSGFNVLPVMDGADAMTVYGNTKYTIDAIVSDLQMPKVGGVKLAEFNYDNKGLPFVACTVVDDASLAISLLGFGVQDYIEKPVDVKKLIFILNHLIARSWMRNYGISEDVYEGNVASINISSKTAELYMALDWIRSKVWDSFDKKENNRFLNFTHEFLLNAHEHGNMGIKETEKSWLIESGEFESEVKSREENANNKHILVAVSVLKNEIAITITDDGFGFDHNKYLNMSDDEVLERLDMPNGRGIYVSKSYFDSIKYDKGGASVMLRKRLSK